ncbi:hydroxyacid dehydrogenase [Pseudactinotalea sp. Z1739]|uniref:hydroxyacid dehydrogenase n=1 Tax=Pseudactinotalea sp. Z1739 TaxID=3413028 RepID=UPI003C7B21C0
MSALTPAHPSGTGAGARRPKAVLVMLPRAFREQFGPAEHERLHTLAQVDEPAHLTRLDTVEARARLAEVEVLITSWGCPHLDADILDHAPNLSVVLHAAGTVRALVSSEVWRRGIQVSNCADENAIPVAEFTLAAIIMAGKKAPFIAAAARTGRATWSDYRKAFGPMTNLDTTVGIIGFSKIGRRVVQRLRTLEVSTLVYDPLVDPEEIRAAGARPASLSEILRRAGTVSVHAPALPSTRHMIGAAELAQMADYATLINTARGSLVDTAALEAECASGRLNAILDVTDPEPLPPGSVLYDLPNVMLTPHIAGSQGNETLRMSRNVLDELERYATGQPLRSAVTATELEVMA